MAKKLPESSQPVKLTKKNAKDIFNKALSKEQKAVVRKLAVRQAIGDDSHINYSDIPPLSDEQLARMVHLRDVRQPKVPVSVRLDPVVLDWLKSKGEGHLTRINDILVSVMDAERRMQAKR